ncbi:MAG: mechanosensitive ion channel family protein [Acidimicrobiia bacterium]
MDNLSELFEPSSNSFWNLALAVVFIVGSIIAARYVRRYVRRKLADYEGLEDYAGATVGRAAGWIVVFIGVVLALSVMGMDMVPVVLIIAIIVAFLLLSGQSMIQNWAAGLLLQTRRPFKPGDRIESLGYVGDVQLVNVRSVIIVTGDGQVAHLPNNDVLTNPLVNVTGQEEGRRSSMTFGVAYGTDLAMAEQILRDAAASVTGVHTEPAPSAWVEELGETTVDLELRFWHDYSTRHTVRSGVAHQALSDLEAAKVEMPFPTQELIISDGAEGDHNPTPTDGQHSEPA